MSPDATDLDSPHGRLAWARSRAFGDKADFARRAGINPTTYRAYENGQNGFAKHAPAFAKLLGVTTDWLLQGGDAPADPPPVSTTPPEANAITFPMEGASAERMREDLPIYGTALGGSMMIEGEAVEQTALNQGEVLVYAKRPVILNGNAKAYGLYVQGSSMDPVHREGSLLLAQAGKPLRAGDDVIVYLRANGDEDHEDDGQRARCVLVKRFVRRTSAYVELQQFTPAKIFKIEATDILRIDRVFTLDELIS